MYLLVRERFEREKVFNIQRRLKRWEMNNKNWSNDTTESDLDLVKKKEANTIMDQLEAAGATDILLMVIHNSRM